MEEANKKIPMWKFGFSALLMILGMAFNLAGIGKNYFMGYQSVGTYLIFCGALIAFIVIIKLYTKRKLVDERMMEMSNKAARVTFVAMIGIAFAVMIADGISPIDYPYSLFMSYFVCALLLVYVSSYYILLKYR